MRKKVLKKYTKFLLKTIYWLILFYCIFSFSWSCNHLIFMNYQHFMLLPDLSFAWNSSENSESIDYFFKFLQNYNYYIDLLKISKILEVRKLTFQINQYIKSHNVNVDFSIQICTEFIPFIFNSRYIYIYIKLFI